MRHVAIVFFFIRFLAAQSADVDVGKANFRLHCAPCHGIHAQGGRGPDLRHTEGDVVDVIAHGVPGTEMGAYSPQFDDALIGRMAAYIRAEALPAAGPVPGDVANGAAIYHEKGNCEGCHASGVGPGLSRVGRQRSLEYLREKLRDPSASITPGYSTLIVRLRDGTTVRGIEKGLDDFSAQLMDANRRFHSFRKEDVVSMERDPHSLMPATDRLTTGEVTDLLAYLSSLRGQQ